MRQPTSTKVHITMRLEADLLVELEALAQKHGVDRTAMITSLLSRGVRLAGVALSHQAPVLTGRLR